MGSTRISSGLHKTTYIWILSNHELLVSLLVVVMATGVTVI